MPVALFEESFQKFANDNVRFVPLNASASSNFACKLSDWNAVIVSSERVYVVADALVVCGITNCATNPVS